MSLELQLPQPDFDLVLAIGRRAMDAGYQGRDLDGRMRRPIDMIMDLSAVHLHGGGLKLAELLKAPEVDFAHDIAGIVRHLDRKSGKLLDCFSPRYHA